MAANPGANNNNATPTNANAIAPGIIAIAPNPAAANTKPNEVNNAACMPTSSRVVSFVALANGI